MNNIDIKQQADGVEKKVIFYPKKLEILIYGVAADNERRKPMIKSLQKQIDKHSKVARALFYIDKGEKTDEEKKAWLVENSNCKYYAFAPENFKVADNYIKTIIAKIKEFEFRLHSLKDAGVFAKKKSGAKEEIVEVIEPAKVISIAPNKTKENE